LVINSLQRNFADDPAFVQRCHRFDKIGRCHRLQNVPGSINAGSARSSRRNSIPFIFGMLRSSKISRRSSSTSGGLPSTPRSGSSASRPFPATYSGFGILFFLNARWTFVTIQRVSFHQQNIQYFVSHLFYPRRESKLLRCGAQTLVTAFHSTTERSE